MILVADSGSTKTDWILNIPDTDQKIEFRTKGINPFFLSEREIIKILSRTSEIQPYLNSIDEVYFFGAGCSSPDSREIVSNAISHVFQNAFINVENDLTGAAFASCGNQPGLCCILGTGSNICYFDGLEVQSGKHGLGFILGDEGSGTFFGKKLITDYLYKTMPLSLQKAFTDRFNINKEIIIREVYGKASPNFYLASFSLFLSEHADDKYIQQIISSGLEEFIITNVKSYPDYRIFPTHFIGSIAFHFSEILKEVCNKHAVKMGKILEHPIEELNKFILEREKV